MCSVGLWSLSLRLGSGVYGSWFRVQALCFRVDLKNPFEFRVQGSPKKDDVVVKLEADVLQRCSDVGSRGDERVPPKVLDCDPRLDREGVRHLA